MHKKEKEKQTLTKFDDTINAAIIRLGILEKSHRLLVEALIDAYQRFIRYQMDVDADVPFEHRQAMEQYKKLIEKETGKSIDELY